MSLLAPKTLGEDHPMRRLLILVMLMIVIWGNGSLFAYEDNNKTSIPITVWNFSKYRGKNQPFFVGVPLPLGQVMSVENLSVVTDKGKTLPTQVQVTSRWPQDGSIRWLGVDFLGDVGANRGTRFHLVYKRDEVKTPDSIRVTKENSVWTVDTGTLKFLVDAKQFRLLENLWLDPRGKGRYSEESVIGAVPLDGLTLRVGEQRLGLGDGIPVNIELEELGPVKVVLRMDGVFGDLSKDPGVEFGFTIRWTVYSGQPYIRWDYILTNRSKQNWVQVQEATVNLPLRMEKGESIFTFGSLEGAPSATLGEYDVVEIAQRGEDQVQISGFNESFSKIKGWVDLENGKTGLGVAVRWFSELYPKKLSGVKGGIRLELIPADGEPVTWPSGTAKTHRFYQLFHPTGNRDARRLLEDLSGRLPVATADPDWICSSRVFGNIGSTKQLQSYEILNGIAQAYDNRWLADLEKILLTGTKGRLTPEQGATGIFNFGDLPFISDDKSTAAAQKTEEIYWGNHFYDLPQVFWVQLARTGDPACMELAEIFVLHLEDVDTVNPTGYARVSPARMHARDYRTRDLGYATDFSFIKNRSMLNHYYLLGDRRGLELAISVANLVLNSDGIDYHAPKSIGLAIMAVLSGYEATGDSNYLKRARDILGAALEWQNKYDGAIPADYTYQTGLVLEGYMEYLRWVDDPEISQSFLEALDNVLFHFWSLESMRIQDDGGLALSGPLGFAYHLTGEERYREIALKQLVSWLSEPSSVRNARDFALYYRNVPYLLGWLTEGKEKPVKN